MQDTSWHRIWFVLMPAADPAADRRLVLLSRDLANPATNPLERIVGRDTVSVLFMNDPEVVWLRSTLQEDDVLKELAPIQNAATLRFIIRAAKILRFEPAATASLLSAQMYPETCSLTIHMILRAIGEEHYTITPSTAGLTLNTTFEYSDRGNKRTTTADLRMKSDYTPLRLEIKERPEVIEISGSPAPITPYFSILGSSPFAIQLAMMPYWRSHGEPASLPVIRNEKAADPIRILPIGADQITLNGRSVKLAKDILKFSDHPI